MKANPNHWLLLHPRATAATLGYLPSFLSEADPRSALEQLNANYVFGGFQPFEGFELDKATMLLTYPGDPPMLPLAIRQLHEEKVFLYPYSWVLILAPSGTFQVARLD